MDLLMISLSVFGWITGTAGLILGSWAYYKACSVSAISDIKTEATLRITEERLKALVDKKLTESLLQVREQAAEDAADMLDNIISVEAAQDPYKASSFKNLGRP